MISSQSGEYICCSDLLQNPQMSNLKVPGNVNVTAFWGYQVSMRYPERQAFHDL